MSIKFQLKFFLKEVYNFSLTEITPIKNTNDGLSSKDKMLMNQTKLDEGVIILSDLNIEYTTKRIEQMIDIKLEPGELDYYVREFAPNDLQITLVNAYLAYYYRNYRDLNLQNNRDYIHILLLLKKKVLMELGFNSKNDGELKAAALPYIITANMSDKVNTRLIRNAEFSEELEKDSTYQYLITHKYKYLESIKPGYIKLLISSFINTRFTFCVFEQPELLGKEISFPKEKLSSELLWFLNSI